MQFQTGQPRATLLRIAGPDHDAPAPARLRAAAREVALENHSSRTMGPDDARWLLAQDVEASLEGGRAAIIRPEVRRRLVSKATGSGLRPFDANLVMAIVQDSARRGERLNESQSRLSLVGPAEATARISPLALLAASIAGAIALLGVLVAWLA